MNIKYFQQLNQILKSHERAIPFLLLDLDRLDKNLNTLQHHQREDLDIRIVVKSLPSLPLVEYACQKLNTNKLMVFHQPFLSELSKHYGNDIDILMGKPMPIKTAKYYYQTLESKNGFNPSVQLQWLVDTEQRILEYIDLAKTMGQKIRLNLELDVGLHRGGFSNLNNLTNALELIESHAEYVEFSGFMGYDPHVVNLPNVLRIPQKAFKMANDFYQRCIDHLQKKHPKLWQKDLTFNGGGSPTLALHSAQKSPVNDISIGSALVKPTHFDVPTLVDFEPAAWIATPILKAFQNTTLPLLEQLKGILNMVKPNFKHSYFIYGGYWKADYVYPLDANENQIFGSSTNQSMINSRLALQVDDFVFLRPTQSEFVLLQFGSVLLIRNGQIVGEWDVLKQ